MMEESWTEKYRPKTFDDFINNDKDIILKILNKPKSMPHLLLVSRTAGTGKTTLAKLIPQYFKADTLIINSSKDRKIEVIRERVVKFSSSMSSNNDVPRFIIMDEIDGMGLNAQEALRGVMEEFHDNCKFILTGNSINKIHDAIQSRCVKINFKTPQKTDIYKYLDNICKKENIVYESDDVLNKIIDNDYPSIRNMINNLQLLSIQHDKNIMIEHIVKSNDYYKEIWALIKKFDFLRVREKVIKDGYNIEELFYGLYDVMLADDIKDKKNCVLLFADTAYKIAVGADTEITFAAHCIKLERYL